MRRRVAAATDAERTGAGQGHPDELSDVTVVRRRVAAAADAERTGAGQGHPGEVLEKAAEGLMSCFRVCAGDT